MVAVGRLKRRPDFLRVAAGRRRWVAPGLILQAVGHRAEGAVATALPPRVGFTASAKIGGAVVRNRARRRLRAVAAAVMPEHARVGHDYVLIARAATASRPFTALLADLESGLKRLGLYQEKRNVTMDRPETDHAA